MKLYSIFYTGDICGNPKTFEGVTDNFEKWLEEHNKDRVKENGEEDPDFAEDWEEGADNFEVEEVALSLYNKENIEVSSNGKTSVSNSENVGSIPTTSAKSLGE